MLKRKALLGCLMVVMVSGLLGCSQAAVADGNRFQGTIEAEEVDLNAKIAGRLSEVLVEEGQSIEKGKAIAKIDARDLAAKREGLVAVSNAAKAGIAAAKSQYDAMAGQLDASKATLNKAENGARIEEVAKAQANYDLVKKSYDRVKTLFDSNFSSQAQLDEVATKLDVAELDLKMAVEGARQEDIEAAKGQVAAVMGQLAAAQMNIAAAEEKYAQSLAGIDELDTYIQDATIKSPISGTVTLINASAGEMISTGMNVATITDLSNTWIQVNVDESQLAQFKEGQKVEVTTITYGEQAFEGTVVQINKRADFAVKKASTENGKFDLVSYAIKVKIDNKDGLFRPGMTAFIAVLK